MVSGLESERWHWVQASQAAFAVDLAIDIVPERRAAGHSPEVAFSEKSLPGLRASGAELGTVLAPRGGADFGERPSTPRLTAHSPAWPAFRWESWDISEKMFY